MADTGVTGGVGGDRKNIRPLRRSAPIVIALLCGLLLSVTGTPTAHAVATYYVSPAGRDTAPGDQAHPFATIQHCADRATDAGYTCVIMPGTYREDVRVTHSGRWGSPITFRAQAPGTVRVDGTDPIAGWTPVTAADLSALAAKDQFIGRSPFAAAVQSGRIYRTHVDLDPSIAEPQLYVGDRAMSAAAFPDPAPDPLEPTVQVARAGSTGMSIVDTALSQPEGYWNGAHVYAQTQFTAVTGVVQSSTPSRVVLAPGWYGASVAQNPACGSVVANQTRYFMYGKLSELNAPREWFYDRSTKTLYFSPPDGAQPGPGAVSVKRRLYGFDLNGVSDTTISGVGLFGATIRTGDASERVTLSGLDVRYPSQFTDFVPDADPSVGRNRGCDSQLGGVTTTGVILRGRYNSVRDSTIAGSSGNGVAMLGDHNSVTNNVIHDVDSSGGRPAGVFMFGHDQTIMNNTIYSAGRGAIEVTSQDPNLTMPNNRIAYNDLYGYGRLEQDFGGIYICCNINFVGSSIDHNWVHDPRDMAGVGAIADIGIYVDGGASNQLIHSNVGWGNNHLTVGLVSTGGAHNRVFNNDGGVYLFHFSPAPTTEIANNIGDLVMDSSDSRIARQANLQPSADPGYPGYVDEGARDFRLRGDSVARGHAQPVAGVTDGGNDPRGPSAGAYQYGAPYWRPGATAAQRRVIHPRYGASAAFAHPDGSWIQTEGALGRNDSHPDYYAATGPFSGPIDDDLQLTYQPPAGAKLAIDHVELRLFARMHRQMPETDDGNVVVSVDGIPVFDARHADFDATGRPVTIDLTPMVHGDWTKLPRVVDVRVTMGYEPYQPGWDGTSVVLHAAEVVIQAHPA